MEVWSHRGRTSQKQLGNSYTGFLSLNNMEITGIETDICLTKDREVIIYHPKSVTPDPKLLTLEEIRYSIFDIMDLDLFLLYLKYSQVCCCLDIKQNSNHLVEMAVEAIVRHGLQDRVYLTAFQKSMDCPPFNIESDGQLLILAKRICPEIKTHVIVAWPYDLLKIADKYQPNAISIGWLLEPPVVGLMSRTIFKTLSSVVNLSEQIEKIKLRGIRVLAGVFNNPEDMLYFASMGVDGIMTDEPKILIDLIKAKKIP
ncbi:MAG: glycerophosphodiester phosphodiesterase [Candidatus Yanofskybacteria bacterium]|nr:glycerophosphodiester phosphodiesterase [Candidatus Yanofskybacteria bacterium]